MSRLLALFAVALAPLAALAQDVTTYNRALAAFNAGDLDTAAPLFFEISEGASDPEIKGKAEYYLAQTFAQKGLPVSAFVTYAAIVKAGPSHPSYLEAVEGLVDMQQQLDEQNLIPSLLNQAYTEEVRDQWVTLPREVLARINYLVGTISQRRGQLRGGARAAGGGAARAAASTPRRTTCWASCWRTRASRGARVRRRRWTRPRSPPSRRC